MSERARSLSGFQPSGELHLGNWFGALARIVSEQDGAWCVIANYHALTTAPSPEALRAATLDTAAGAMALGLDPTRAVLFRQSDVPEVTELAWLLLTVSGMGLLERGHAYKSARARSADATGALLTYPVLMSADILALGAARVTVGQDQVQHIEMCRDIATSFNARYGEVFALPDYALSEAPNVPGTDGRKMSKTARNTIPIFAEGEALRARVNAIVTDGRDVAAPKDPDGCTVFQLYRYVAGEADVAEMAARYRAGGYGYGEAKARLADAIESTFAPARARRAALLADPAPVEAALRDGGARARAVAADTVARARRAVGL